MGMQLTLTSVCGPSRRLLDKSLSADSQYAPPETAGTIMPLLGEVVIDDNMIITISLHQPSGGSGMADPLQA